MIRPSFFISGAPRCGTTALYQYLSEHPRIFMSEVKETNYFATDFPHVQKVVYRTVQDYHRLFENAKPEHQAAGEASPFYLFSQVAFEKMRAYDPQAKVILSLRNPVDFVQSYHQLNLSLLREDEPNLAKAWALSASRSRGENIPPSARQPELILYPQLGQWSRHLQKLYAIFPPQQVKVYLYEDLAANTRAVYEDLLQFIGVPSDGRTNFAQINAGFGVKSPLLARLFHPPQFLYKPLMKMAGLLGAGFMKNAFRLYDRLERLNTARTPRASLSPALRAEMEEHFRPDVEQLQNILGRDLSHWFHRAV